MNKPTRFDEFDDPAQQSIQLRFKDDRTTFSLVSFRDSDTEMLFVLRFNTPGPDGEPLEDCDWWLSIDSAKALQAFLNTTLAPKE